MSKVMLVTLTCLTLAINSAAYSADPYVTGTYEPLTEGYLLMFTLHNALLDEVITYWSITTSDATNPVTPAGWYIYQDFRKVEWFTQDPSYQLQPGNDLGGFGFAVPNPPGTLGWFAASNRWSYIGDVTPTLIPEPSSLLVLCGAMGAVGLSLIRHRRRRN